MTIITAIAKTVHRRYPGLDVKVWENSGERPTAAVPVGNVVLHIAQPGELRTLHISVVGVRYAKIVSARPKSCCIFHFREDLDEIVEGLDAALRLMDLGDDFLQEIRG